MKKTICIVAVIITVVLLCFSLTACRTIVNSLFGKSDEDSGEAITITVYGDGSYSKTYNVKGKYPNVTPVYKTGHYLLGFYDAEEGGQKYFDTAGKPVVNYSDSNPIAFYAQWAEIGNLSYESEWDREPKTNLNDLTIDNDYFVNAAIGNPDSLVAISLYLSVKYVTNLNGGAPEVVIRFTDSNESGYEVYGSKQYTMSNQNYEDYVVNIDLKAEVFHLGQICLWADEQYWAPEHHYYKDVKLVATFK